MAKMEVQNFIQNGYRYTSTVHVVLKMLLEKWGQLLVCDTCLSYYLNYGHLDITHPFRKARYMVGKVMEHIAFHLFTILLILFDIAIVVTDLAAGSSAHYHDELEICSRVIITYFMLEVMLRIFYKG